MKTLAPPLLPLFRSDGQARVLVELYLKAPPGGISLTELAERAGLSLSTVHREANRLEAAGLVRSSRGRRVRRLAANPDSPFHAELRALLLKAFGPVHVLRPLLLPIDGVRAAHIFGSWARRYLGENGEAPADIDVLVIGEPLPDEVYAACRRAEQELGLDVNPTILSEREWREGGSGFLRSLRESPLVPVAER